VLALLLGYVFFGEWPKPIALTGAAIIMATGLFTLWREMQLKRRQAKARRT
jgi:S-adenosylmethionine uptake transporter